VSAARVNKATERVNIKGEEGEEGSILYNYNYGRPFYIKLEALREPARARGQERVGKWIVEATVRSKAR